MELEKVILAHKAMMEEGRIRLLNAVSAQQKLVAANGFLFSDRDRLFLRDKANDILYTDLIGRKMAQKFRAAFPGKDIPKTERFVDGAVRSVNWYEDVPAQRELMEKSVQEFVDETHKRPIKRRTE
eukprot:jgi/Mesvir1/753/Mv17354-RA.1